MPEYVPPPASPSPEVPVPAIDPRRLLETALAVVTRPAEFWPTLAQDGPGLQKPLVFAVAMGLAAGVVQAVVSILHLDGIFGISAGFAGVISVILYPLFAAIGALVGGAILLVIGNVLGARPTFHVALRVAAYASALMPLHPVASIIPFLPLAVSFYGLYVVGLGVIALFPTDARKTWMVMALLAAISLVMTTSAYFAARAARRSLDQYGEAARRFSEQMDKSGDRSKAAEQLRKSADQTGRRP